MPSKSTTARKPKAVTGNRRPVKGADISPPRKPKALTPEEQIAALTEQVAALTALVVDQSSGVVVEDEPKAPSKRKGASKPKASDSPWTKGTIFTYVKKNGAESTFRITEVSGKRVKVRNQGSSFASSFKLTTLDALLQAGNVKDVR
jgi:hypothetical protein